MRLVKQNCSKNRTCLSDLHHGISALETLHTVVGAIMVDLLSCFAVNRVAVEL